jgi:selenocysteine lyase/cysteine desulfurase
MPLTFDVARARADTPACQQLAHLNNAGAALMPTAVVDVVVDHLRLEQKVGGYEAAAMRSDERAAARTAVAALVGAGTDEIALTDSATRSWALALSSIPFQPGDQILTSPTEYASNFIGFLQVAHREGVEIVVVPNDETGVVSVDAMADALTDRVRVVALTHVPTSSGVVNDAAGVGEIVRDSRALYLLDACQSVGQLPIDVRAIGCHLLSATGRKFLRAPRGTGFLYVDRDRVDGLEPPVADLASASWDRPDRYSLQPDARRFELWEHSVANVLGLGVAADYALSWGVDATWARITELAARLREQLATLDGVTLQEPPAAWCGLVTFSVDGWAPADVIDALHERCVNVWSAGVGAARLDMEGRGLEAVVRASVHYLNDDGDLDALLAGLADLVAARR